jgi:hypothetical protein
MNLISSDTFQELFYSIKLNGIYIFIIHDCSVCDNYLDKIKSNNYFMEYNVVNCMEDISFYMETFGLDDMPYTILFNNNTRLYECGGILFDKQVNKLKEFLK